MQRRSYRLMTKMTPLALTAAAVLMPAGHADAAFVLQEDFESYNLGGLDGQGGWAADITYSVADVTAPLGGGTSQALRMSTNANQHVASRALSDAIADNTTGTLFFQYRLEQSETPIGFSDSLSMGASHLQPPLTANTNVQAAYTVLRSNVGTLRARDGNNSPNEVNVTTSLTDDNWNSVWMVLDADANTYDVHVSDGSTVASVTGLDFRYGQNEDIQSFFMINWNIDFNDGALYVDNIYVDPTGENLTNPVPEPGSLALLGLGGLAMLGRRRRAAQA